MNKLRLRLGNAELEYEGDETLSKDTILEFVDRLSKIPDAAKRAFPPAPSDPSTGDAMIDLSVEAIAAKLEAKTGPDLLLAAASYLELSEKKSAYSRGDLHDAAKEGSGYYKSTYGGNLSSILQSLVKNGKLNQRGDKQYSLTATAKTEMLAKLG